jgi:hypothetical protein
MKAEDHPSYLPSADRAIVEDEKITRYLLEWRAASDKSRFFFRVGFSLERPDELRDALLAHARECPIISQRVTDTGISYRLEGPLTTPDGRHPEVYTVWHVVDGFSSPRFVTAAPNRRKRS